MFLLSKRERSSEKSVHITKKVADFSPVLDTSNSKKTREWTTKGFISYQTAGICTVVGILTSSLSSGSSSSIALL
jgi:hypothetical protein